jgi:hypothetical protein
MCGSDEVYDNSEMDVDHIYSSRYVLVQMNKDKNVANKHAILVHYLCADCGNVEIYMNNPYDREKAIKNWKPLNPKQKRKRKNDEL